MKRDIKVFIDFDGTITLKDIGDNLFRTFGNQEIVVPTIDKLLSGKISARESWEKLFDSVDLITEMQLNEFIDSISVDDYFKPFVDLLEENGIDFYILSDGFDYYINRVLHNQGLSNIKYFSNIMKLENNKLQPEFPYYDSSFFNSANCKRNHLINLTSDDDFVILIGDGNSDKYTAEFCDFVFAKNSLIKFCQKENITYVPFKDFSSIIVKMKQIIEKKNLKKRHQAYLKRCELYMMEP